MTRTKFRRGRRPQAVAAVVRGVLFAAAVTVVCVLLFALLIGWTNMGDGVIRVINQIIKLGAIAAGVCFATHKGEETALRRGAVMGLVYMAAGVLLYAVLSAQKLTVTQYLIDLFMGVAVGGLTGMLVGTMKEKAA